MQGKTFDYYPSQLEITFSERCNQDCDYCWVKKSCMSVLKFCQIKDAIDIFYSFPGFTKKITFNSSEVMLYPELYKKVINYIISKCKGTDTTIITTTNGLMLNKKMRDFVKKCFNNDIVHYRFNVSIDGKVGSHNAHRKFAHHNVDSAFQSSWKNILSLPKDIPNLIFTLTPEELTDFQENIDFIIQHGFRKISIFPRCFALWNPGELLLFKRTMEKFVAWANLQGNHLFDDIVFLGRLWGGKQDNKIFLGCDGNFYVFEWVLALFYPQRRAYCIGDTTKGVDLRKRNALICNIFESMNNLLGSRCRECIYLERCGYPIPILFWCMGNQEDLNSHYSNHCQLVKTCLQTALTLNSKEKYSLDRERLNRALCFRH